ncbi:MAG: DegT/DnrJ/EryC1/StrS family aminotransferase [Vulcanimicrobiaceae bacterium]
MRVPLVQPLIDEREIDAVSRVLRSGQLAQGPEVAAFEQEFADSCGARHAVAMNSGTAANHAALAALGVGADDEVLTTPFTFAATSTPILMLGARPRFVDIDPRTFNVDVAHLTAAIGPRTKAAILVDLFGLPFDRTGIDELAGRGIRVVEDACQAVGARRDGRTAGTLGAAGAFSFYATKNIMTGEGGMLVTDDDQIAAGARRFRQHGMSERYEYVALGYNYRMTDVLAALGRVQLGRLDAIAAARRANARRYDAGLAGVPGLTPPFVPAGVEHAYHQYSVLIDPDRAPSGRDRDAVRAFLAEREVSTGVYYPTPLHLNRLFAAFGDGPGAFPNAEAAARRVLALPIHPLLSSQQVDYVIANLREALGVDR